LRDRLPLRERLRHRLAVELVELRLVVERFEVARPAAHVQEDHALRLGRVVRDAREAAVLVGLRCSAEVAREQRVERDGAETDAGGREKRATRERMEGGHGSYSLVIVSL